MQESPDRRSDEVLDIIPAGSKINGSDEQAAYPLLFYLYLRFKITNAFTPAVNLTSPPKPNPKPTVIGLKEKVP
jgi:hypothetical protein